MKKKEIVSSDASGSELPEQKKRQRHIVSWSSEEDEILREQIRLHGTENWVVIASKFKDKSTRQCRRRWFTYLNSDFKRGGWSPEEDMLLCEAQKIFGNRWTEIAKVVSGRTDNAVKNRFTTLCKKRAKHEELASRSNGSTFINANNNFPNGISADGGSETAPPLKRMRIYISNANVNRVEEASGVSGAGSDLHTLVTESACRNAIKIPAMQQNLEEKSFDEAENKGAHGTFLSKDDPKLLALMQQAELLSSLAIKVNSEQTDKSLEDAWMALQDFLKQNKLSNQAAFENPDTDRQFANFNENVEGLWSCSNEGSRRDHYDSSLASSEYSSGSTLPSIDKTEVCQPQQENSQEFEADQLVNKHFVAEGKLKRRKPSRIEVGKRLACSDIKYNDGVVAYGRPNTEFDSPLHVTPLFRALAAAIPSPKFSESEKNFLMKTLGIEPTSPRPISNPSQPPACKRSLLHCL